MSLIQPFKKSKVWGESYTYSQVEKKLDEQKKKERKELVNKTEKVISRSTGKLRSTIGKFSIRGW